MGKVIDLDERRQIKALHQALLGSMARLVRLSRRYGEAMAELGQGSEDPPAAADPPQPPGAPADKPEPDR